MKSHAGRRIRCGLGVVALATALMPALTSAAGPASGFELEGYTEPYRTIRVASDETGTISEVLVREGDAVQAGQPLVKLNSDVYLAALAVAQQNMNSRGRLEAARAERHMRRERLDKLQLLQSKGHAHPEEVERAITDLAIAEANVLSAEDDLTTRRLEYERVRAQIDRRTVRAPISGMVTETLREKGEYVAPNTPEVLTLVQLDPLLAIFTVTSSEANRFWKGQAVKVHFLALRTDADATVEFVAPITDAESGMVRVKVRIDNPDGRYRSGERCKVRLLPASANK